jgi:hypothetical protein
MTAFSGGGKCLQVSLTRKTSADQRERKYRENDTYRRALKVRATESGNSCKVHHIFTRTIKAY